MRKAHITQTEMVRKPETHSHHKPPIKRELSTSFRREKGLASHIKGRNSNTMVTDFNIPISTMHRSSRQNISKGTLNLNYKLD